MHVFLCGFYDFLVCSSSSAVFAPDPLHAVLCSFALQDTVVVMILLIVNHTEDKIIVIDEIFDLPVGLSFAA